MQYLLRFLSKFGSLLLFILLEGFAFYMLFSSNSFQNSVFLSSANKFSGKVFAIQSSLNSYFHLRDENKVLVRDNIRMQQEIARIKSGYKQFSDTSEIALLRFKEANEYRLIPAKVIKNSVIHVRNYMTLDVGTKDGVKPEMGVANTDGIIGVVSKVSEHYSVVIPVLNPEIRFSCKLKKSNTAGSLAWDENDRRFAMLEEIPPYVNVSKGDTIVTSGFSAIFPEGIMVGTVEEYGIGDDANYLRLKVRLSVRFDAVSNVSVVDFKYRDEMKKLEEEAEK
jgi:rod shape-determining protein MreC